jgi:hypothetical protein
MIFLTEVLSSLDVSFRLVRCDVRARRQSAHTDTPHGIALHTKRATMIGSKCTLSYTYRSLCKKKLLDLTVADIGRSKLKMDNWFGVCRSQKGRTSPAIASNPIRQQLQTGDSQAASK